ncbi:MAG: 5-deoxy-glucuronate isomerase, partial [Clostridia bacterium]|nr:5-deoxy-glucuronate isomerase [Clostridia bacterium]
MNLKKSYVEKYGYERVITDRNSPLTYAELDFLKLEDGRSYEISEKGKEFALIILYGKCSVKGENFEFNEVGKRQNVFDAPAEAVYVGKDTTFTVTAKGGDVKIAVCKAPAEKYFAPAYVPVSEIKTKDLGKGAYARKAAFNFPETVGANLLYIGEFWVEDGNWASYPPHKHDLDNMPTEGFLDEIYYFEFDKPQ